MKNKWVQMIVRLTVSVSLLIFLFSRIDTTELKKVFHHFNAWLYLLAVAVTFFYQFIWALSWKLSLSAKNIAVRSRDIFKAVLTSYVFGTFLPSSIGPELILAFNLGKSLPEKHHAAGSLLFIKVMNIASSLFVAGLVLLLMPRNDFLNKIVIITWALVLAAWVICWLSMHSNSRKFMEGIAKKYPRLGFLYKIFDSFGTFGLSTPTLLKVWLIGVFMAFLKVCVDYLFALSLDIHISYFWFLGLVPAIAVISYLPVSIAGLGVREGAYVLIFSQLSVAPENSISISLLGFTLNIWMFLIGIILYSLHGTHVPHTYADKTSDEQTDDKRMQGL
jgi:glycosyltransferase 2 family protein